MLTLTKSPPLVSLTGNPIRFTIHTDNDIDSPAQLSGIFIIFYSAPNAGSTIHLLWGSMDILLTAVPAPDQSGLQLPDATQAATRESWVIMAAAAMRLNYIIDRDWTITTSGNTLTMVGKAGVTYKPTTIFNWASSTETPYAINTTGHPAIGKLFYKIHLVLNVKVDGEWITAGQDVLPVNASSDAVFDIHTLFTDLLAPTFKFPESESLAEMFLIRPKSSCEYRIQYFESFGNPILPGNVTDSTSFFAIPGGISHLQQAIYNRQNQSFWDKLQYNNYFLTWQPRYKKVSPRQVEKLFFLAQTAMTNLKLRANFYYLDGTSQLAAIVSAQELVPDKSVWEITASPFIVSKAATKPTILDYYELYLEFESERISMIHTFKLDYAPYEHPRYFIFLNALGGFDTFRTTGEVVDTLEYERTTVNKILGSDFTEMTHQTASGFISEVVHYKANTGWISREAVAWIRDFLLSQQIYQIISNKLVPIVITTTQAQQKADKEMLFAIEFEYRRAFYSEYYSQELVFPEFNDDFNDDFANE